jgi:hypothetical protein
VINNRALPLLLIFLSIHQVSLFCGAVIEEKDIPMPEVMYELPQNLIGEFLVASIGGEFELTIFSNNKYIWHSLYPPQESYHCGHIIKKDNTYFFIPIINLPGKGFIGGGYFSFDGNEIYLNDNTFSFQPSSNTLWRAIRKDNIPIPGETFASDVTISMKISKRRYFFSDQNNETIDLNELRPPYYNGLYHELEITNGIVAITRTSGPNFRFQDMRWKGFLEKTKSETDALKGTIWFTNGNPYYYIEKGIAFLELNADTIRVTMPCTNEVEEAIRQINSKMKSPIYLVLEF